MFNKVTYIAQSENSDEIVTFMKCKFLRLTQMFTLNHHFLILDFLFKAISSIFHSFYGGEKH